MQQLSGSSGRGGTLTPSTTRTVSGSGPLRGAGPANLEPKKMFCIGGEVGDFLAPVVRPDSSSILEASSSTFTRSSASFAMAGNGFETGDEPTGC
jgi:hypothetical protein